MSNEPKSHAAEAALTRVRELTNAVKELLREAQGKSELSNPVRTIMKGAPDTVTPRDTLGHVAEILWQADCGSVPVVEDDGRLVGIVTDRDICMASHFRGAPISAIDAGSTMSKELFTASPDESIESVARLMGDKQLRRVPIVEDGRLVGIVALADLARLTKSVESSTACRMLAHTVAAISERRTPPRAASAAAE